MTHSAAAAMAGGLLAGCAVGAISRLALKRAMRASNAAFFGVFAAGMVFRLIALLAALWPLRHERYIIIIAFAGAMIAAQTAFELVPLKENGTKRNP